MKVFQNVCGSLGTILANRDEVHDGGESRINFENACHYSV
jgi:hypothetical protein